MERVALQLRPTAIRALAPPGVPVGDSRRYASDSDEEDELVHQMDLKTELPETLLSDSRKRASAISEEPVSAKVGSALRGGLVRRTASKSRP